MIRCGWLADLPGYVGGAELTHAEFSAAAPEGVEVVSCPPGEVEPGLDIYVAHNVVYYRPDDLKNLGKTLWFHHDLSPHNDPEVKAWLDENATHIFCSPLQRDKYGLDGECIPPALDLSALKAPRQSRKRRSGTCSIAQWRGPGKGAQRVAEWAAENGQVDVYGSGSWSPHGPNLRDRGPLAPSGVAQTLWRYERFVFLPTEIEPFGRTVAEAHLAGCEVVTNNLVGATYWLSEKPEALQTAAQDFWSAVCG